MHKTRYYCDICKGEVTAPKIVIASIDEKMFDLCPDCKNIIWDYCRSLRDKFGEVPKP